jgi:hypothetical protein
LWGGAVLVLQAIDKYQLFLIVSLAVIEGGDAMLRQSTASQQSCPHVMRLRTTRFGRLGLVQYVVVPEANARSMRSYTTSHED